MTTFEKILIAVLITTYCAIGIAPKMPSELRDELDHYTPYNELVIDAGPLVIRTGIRTEIDDDDYDDFEYDFCGE